MLPMKSSLFLKTRFQSTNVNVARNSFSSQSPSYVSRYDLEAHDKHRASKHARLLRTKAERLAIGQCSKSMPYMAANPQQMLVRVDSSVTNRNGCRVQREAQRKIHIKSSSRTLSRYHHVQANGTLLRNPEGHTQNDWYMERIKGHVTAEIGPTVPY